MDKERYSRVRSVLETPVLDARKWAKLPSIPSDGVLVDMEDAVPIDRKEQGRAAVVEALRDRSFFGDRLVLARPNPLSTPWGYEDVVALAEVGVDCMMYPKVRSVGEVQEVQRLLREHGADPDIVVIVETPHAVAQVEELAGLPKVAALSFGEGDLTADLGIPIHLPDGRVNPAILPARMRTILAGAAADVHVFDFAVLQDIRDTEECRARAIELASYGVTSMMTIYPPHVEVINDVLTPTDAEVARAREVVEAMEAARAAGDPAVQLEGGRTLLIHDEIKARRVLARAGATT